MYRYLFHEKSSRTVHIQDSSVPDISHHIKTLTEELEYFSKAASALKAAANSDIGGSAIALPVHLYK